MLLAMIKGESKAVVEPRHFKSIFNYIGDLE